jgi:hypothetical protein
VKALALIGNIILWAIITPGITLLACRGLVSLVVPIGMECDASWSTERERPCAFGPGILGKQECRRGMWQACEVERCPEKRP